MRDVGGTPMRIKDVLSAKPSREVITVSPDASVRDLVGLLAEHNVGALIVGGDGSSVDGIVSERDVVRQLHADESVLDAAVSAIMTIEVQSCSGSDAVNDLMQMMTCLLYTSPSPRDGLL